jgi:hypothetical protein
MSGMNDGVLHEAIDTPQMFGGNRLLSMLDMVGGGLAKCVRCGRWEYFAQLSARDARGYLGAHGWTFSGYDESFPLPCPTCGHIEPNDWKGVDVCPLCSRSEPASASDAVGQHSE